MFGYYIIIEARKKINEEQPSQKDIVSSKDEEEATLTGI